MAIRQEDWHEIYGAAEGSWGSKVAGNLMELLPPVGWADVVTKHDLELSQNSLRNEILAEVYRTSAVQTRTIIIAMITAMLGTASLVLAAFKL